MPAFFYPNFASKRFFGSCEQGQKILFLLLAQEKSWLHHDISCPILLLQSVSVNNQFRQEIAPALRTQFVALLLSYIIDCSQVHVGNCRQWDVPLKNIWSAEGVMTTPNDNVIVIVQHRHTFAYNISIMQSLHSNASRPVCSLILRLAQIHLRSRTSCGSCQTYLEWNFIVQHSHSRAKIRVCDDMERRSNYSIHHTHVFHLWEGSL